MIRKTIIIPFIASIIAVSSSCGSTKPISYGDTDEYGCRVPPESVFTTNGVELSFAQSTFGKVVTGDIKAKNNPRVVSLASQVVRDDELRTYLRCLALKRDKFTIPQIAYFQNIQAILATGPSTKELLEWFDSNPFPQNNRDSNSNLITEIEDNGNEDTYDLSLSVNGSENDKVGTRETNDLKINAYISDIKSEGAYVLSGWSSCKSNPGDSTSRKNGQGLIDVAVKRTMTLVDHIGNLDLTDTQKVNATNGLLDARRVVSEWREKALVEINFHDQLVFSECNSFLAEYVGRGPLESIEELLILFSPDIGIENEKIVDAFIGDMRWEGAYILNGWNLCKNNLKDSAARKNGQNLIYLGVDRMKTLVDYVSEINIPDTQQKVNIVKRLLEIRSITRGWRNEAALVEYDSHMQEVLGGCSSLLTDSAIYIVEKIEDKINDL